MTELKPCPFCGRSMRYKETQYAIVWDVRIEHDYDKSTPYTPCPLNFSTCIEWKKIVWENWFDTGEAIEDEIVNAQKQRFIEDWNRGAEE